MEGPRQQVLPPKLAVCGACGKVATHREAGFCTKCGTSLQSATPQGRLANRKTCPNCNHRNFRRNAQFCEKCECKLNSITDVQGMIIASIMMGLAAVGLIYILIYFL